MKSLVVISIFSLAVVLLFSEVLFGPRAFLDANPYHYHPWQSYAQEGDTDNKTYRTDALFTYYPRRVELTRSIREGRIPLWNPYILAGMPFFADPQSRVVYPIALLLVLADPMNAMAYDVTIHLVIAMLGAYLFLRTIRVNTWGSLLGGLAFGFSSFFYVRFGHPTFIAAASWIPFFFYGLEKARKRGPAGTVMLAVFLAVGYLAGFPQVFFFGVGALLLYALHTSLGQDRSNRKAVAVGTARIVLIAGLLSSLLVAVQLVPFVEFLRNSVGLGVDIEKMTDVYLAPPVLLLRSLFPDLFGNPIEGTDWSGLTRDLPHPYNPEFAVYCGLGTLLAAVSAMVFIRGNRHVRFFSGLLLLTVGLATSRVLIRLGYAVLPFLETSRISRISILACFALAALGGIGFSKVTDGLGDRRRRQLLIVVGAVAVVVLVVALYVAIAGDAFIGDYLSKAKELPGHFWKRTHQEMRSSRIRDWIQGAGREWIEYEKHQVGRGLGFLTLTFGVLALIIRSKKTPGVLKTGLIVVFVALVAMDAGLIMRGYFITQVSSRLFDTDGISLLKDRVGDMGMWRMRSVKYQHEDIKAFPPNTNLLFDIHSLNGTSTMWPAGYQRLYDAFGGARPVSKRWDKQMALGLYEALASDFACVRYVVASNEGLPVVSPPLIRLVAARAGTPSRVRIVGIGDESRLALWQLAGETFNFVVDLPRARALEFAVGFDAASFRPGDAITVWLEWEQGGRTAGFSHTFDLARDGTAWHPFSVDLSGMSGGRTRIRLGSDIPASLQGSLPVVAWGGLDITYGNCPVNKTGDEHVISLENGADYVVLEMESEASEVPLEILTRGFRRKVRWLAFPQGMPVRRLYLDLRERGGNLVIIKSDSAFTVRDCDMVYLDVGCADYDLIYDRDMYIYENLAVIRKGVCLERSALIDRDGCDDARLAVSPFEEIGNLECGRCDIVSYRPEKVVLDVKAESDCFLLFQDVWYPGWQGYVDGDRVDIEKTDIGMRAIEVAAGEHRVEMRYSPRSIKIGLALTCLGIILSLAYTRKRGHNTISAI